MLGGSNEAPLIWKRLSLNEIAKFRGTSTSPGMGDPGAPGLDKGCKFVSSKGLMLEDCVVIGSTTAASLYRRIANPGGAGARFEAARTQ